MEHLGVCYRTVSRYLRFLVDNGCIRIERKTIFISGWRAFDDYQEVTKENGTAQGPLCQTGSVRALSAPSGSDHSHADRAQTVDSQTGSLTQGPWVMGPRALGQVYAGYYVTSSGALELSKILAKEGLSGIEMSRAIKPDILRRLQKIQHGIVKPDFIGEEQAIWEISKTYDEMAQDRNPKHHSYLPPLRAGREAFLKCRWWRYFQNVSEICKKYDITPRLWLEAQFDAALSDPTPFMVKNSRVPTPQMLCSELAHKKFLWFLERSDKITEEGETGYAVQRSLLREVWEGPISLGTWLLDLKRSGGEITIEGIVATLEATPELFEPEYLLTQPRIRKMVFGSKVLSPYVQDAFKILAQRDGDYREKLLDTYNRSLDVVREHNPEIFEAVGEWI